MNKMCLVVSDNIKKLTENITQAFPEASKRANLTPEMVAEWVGAYNQANNENADFIPTSTTLVNYIEKQRNMDGKSFKYIPKSITYNLPGQAKQTYTIIGNKIFNKDGKEVFTEAGKHRNKIFANFAVQEGRAVVVEHKNKKYVVNDRNQIISVTTGDIMNWGEENGDRKEILRLSQIAFREKQKAETTTVNSGVASEVVKNNSTSIPVVLWQGFWTREQVANQQDKIFLFGDNTNDRVSIHYVPSSTQAVIRGLPNAIGIDTKKNRGTGANSYFSDADFDQFKAQVDSVLNAAKADGRTIVIPADGIGTGKAMLKEKAPKCFEYLQSELQKLQNPTINQEENRSKDEEIKEIEQIITVAPYFRNRLTSENKEQLGRATEKVKEKAQKLAATMGLQIETVEVVGGTYQGSSEITYQYRIKSSDQQMVDLFAALMGDLSNEYQDSVIAANYTKDKSKITAYELTWKTPEGTTIEKIETLLKSLGIEGSTFHFSDGQLDIIAFGEEETQEIINKLKDTDYEFKEFNGQNSRYLDNEYRRNAYQSWLNSERGKQNRQLNNACQKALAICEAAAQYPDVEDKENHPQEQKKQEQLRLAAAQKAEREWKVPTSSSPSNAASALNTENTNNLAAGSASLGFAPNEASGSMEEVYQRLAQQAAQNATTQNEQAVSKPKPQEPKSKAYESALKPSDSRIAKFSRTFSPQQIKDRGAMISSIFSDILDDAVEDEIDALLDIVEDSISTEAEKNQAKQKISALRDPVNGRQLAAQSLGIPKIVNEIKERLQNWAETADDDKKILYQNTLEYFTELFNSQASLDIEEREGIRIINLEIAEQTASEDDNDSQNDGDDEVGHIVSGSDGWNYQVRFEDPFNALSKKVRGMLYDVKRPDSEKDDLGFTRHYPMGQIYASLLSYLSKNMQSPDDFVQIDKSYDGQDNWGNDITETSYPNGYPTFPVLEQMRNMYPWVDQIIQRLTDDYLNPDWNSNLRYPSTGGAMASQFYTNFRKAYIPYGKVQIGKGKFAITPLNYQMEDRVQYDKLESNYNNRMILTETSIYGADGKVNKEHAAKLEGETRIASKECSRFSEIPSLMEYHQQHPEDEVITQEDIDEYNEFVDRVRRILQSFGIDATRDSVVTYLQMEENGNTLSGILSSLEWVAHTIANLSDDKIDGFNYITDTRDSYGTNLWAHFFDGRGLITDASYMQSFYDSASKKTKYSYSADNYLMKTFRGACMGTLEQRRRYIDEHFGKFEWFKNQNTGEWRNKWLEFWYNYGGEQKEIPYRNVDNVTEYGNDGEVTIRQYSKWEPDDIWQVQDRSYERDKNDKKTAFYLAPIFSDSPMSMTVKGPKMSMQELLYGYVENGQHKQGAFVQLVNQELWRIGYVQERVAAILDGKVKEIANFDTGRGQQFCFLPELNSYVFENGESFLGRMLRLKNEKATMQEIEAAQIEAIKNVVDAKMAEYALENGKHYTAESPLSEQQYYNMAYANAAIIQMTTVDLAFYKNDVDFQKRYKEVYAGGIQLNTNSKYGKKTENIILLSDDIITSPSYDKIAAIIDSSKNLSDKDKDAIKASFTNINVADAQAIRAMHSFRSVLDMMGKWDDRMEEALNHFKNNEWNREDFDIIFQTIKPFVYATIERSDGFGNTILVPQQNKNSEICALMMYDLITNGLNDSPVYKALSRFMEDTVDGDGNHLIDMVQYESAGKVGNQGVVNISFNPEKVVNAIENGVIVDGKEIELYPDEIDVNDFLPNDIEHASQNYEAIKYQLDKELKNGNISQDGYNKAMQDLRPTEDEIVSMLEQAALITNPDGTKGINQEVVHTIPFDNYYQQTPTPEHHIDTEATFGSQARNIAIADLPDDFELVVKGKSGNHTFKGKDAIIDFYYELLNENLLEDFFGKGKKKGLKGVFESKESLRDAVTEIVRGNPKYGNDFADALQIDDNGNFVLSPNSPTIFTLMQEIVTSFFKNRITKQTINGASLIQAAGIGLDKDLHMVFDKNGKLLGAECYMPLTSKSFFEPLLEEKIIDGKTVKVLSPEKLKQAGLDKAVGYRIPTENKSSMMPLIIKDFTPLQNGSAIVLPAEITNIAGSDFDVDKMFIMLLSFNLITHDKKKAFNDYTRIEHEKAQEMINALGKANIEDIEVEEVGKDFADWFEEHKDEYLLDTPIIKKIEYDFNKSPKENGRKARNNMLIQMIFNILVSKEGSESLFNPQGFADVKHAAKVTRILTDPVLKRQLESNQENVEGVLPNSDMIVSEFLNLLQEKYPNKYEEYKDAVFKMPAEVIQRMYMEAITAGNKESIIETLLNTSTKDLEKFISDYSAPESPVFPQTFAHSHARNMAGANQIGIYAIQGSMTTKYQRADVRLREEQQFTVDGKTITNVDVSDGGKRFKNVGQMLGASADNGKDPNLADMGSTTKTAPIIGYMLRCGLNHLQAAMIINQPHMWQSRYSSKNSKYWRGVLGRTPLAVPTGNVTTEMLIKSLISPFELTAEEDMQIAALCYRILTQHEAQEYLTQISRADSPNGSMQNSYAKARIQQYKVDLFQAKMGQRDFPFVRIKEALSNDAVDTAASEGVIREQLKGQRMAFLHGMYALGINSFQDIVSPYFFGAQKWFDEGIVKPILYNLNEKLPDSKKEEIVNNIYTSYITFVLSGSPLFGSEEGATMKEKRDYYLESFPDDYIKIIQENEDIRTLLGSVLQVKNFDSRKRIILQDVGSLSKGQKIDVQRRFESLVYSKNPVAQELAKKLFIYSYFDNGLQFTHDSFSHLFTTKFLNNFPMYNESLLELDKKISEEEQNNFINQFLLTFSNAAYTVDNFISSDDVANDIIRIDLNDKNMRKRMINEAMSPNPLSEGINVYPYISYQNEIYVLDKDLFESYPGTPIYRKLPQYDTYSKLPLFNINMNVAEMAVEFPVGEDNNMNEMPDVGSVDAPVAHNEGTQDPSVESSMQNSFDSMDDFEAPDYYEAPEPQDDTERYQVEGEGELRDPMCQ